MPLTANLFVVNKFLVSTRLLKVEYQLNSPPETASLIQVLDNIHLNWLRLKQAFSVFSISSIPQAHGMECYNLVYNSAILKRVPQACEFINKT